MNERVKLDKATGKLIINTIASQLIAGPSFSEYLVDLRLERMVQEV